MTKIIGACLYLPVISSLRNVYEQAFDLLRAGDLIGANFILIRRGFFVQGSVSVLMNFVLLQLRSGPMI